MRGRVCDRGGSKLHFSFDSGFNSRPCRPSPGPDRAWFGGRYPPARSIHNERARTLLDSATGTGLHRLQSRPGSFGIEPTVPELIFVEARCLIIVL
jgi:hypothetical protein